MTQNSRSPVVKSSISSSSGRTISVEKRILACTGTTSSFPYLTTRAPVSLALAGPAIDRSVITRIEKRRREIKAVGNLITVLLERDLLRVSVVEPTGERVREQDSRSQQRRERKSEHRWARSKPACRFDRVGITADSR